LAALELKVITMNKQRIGIVGGMGSYAGLDLLRKVYDVTPAISDSEHFPVTLISAPQQTTDRTQFLIGQSSLNPSVGMLEIISQLAEQGASIIGIPCNTAHANKILNEVQKALPQGVTLVHLIESVVDHIVSEYPTIKKVGIIGTTGTIRANIYKDALLEKGLKAVHPSDHMQENYVMSAIYAEDFGIKAHSNPVTEKATEYLLLAADELIEKGSQIIILGCTEIPLAITQASYQGYPCIDATKILAQQLVKTASAN
jgi:aspartate racemase